MLEFPCEDCGALIKVPDARHNEPAVCSNCNTRQAVPADAMPAFDPPPRPQSRPLIVTTGNDVAGHEITAYLGIVRGIVVRAPTIGQSFFGGLSSIAGGNIPEYVQVCEAAREHAYQLMIQHAQQKDADALIAVRYDATEFRDGITEVLAYGTAVKLKKSDHPEIGSSAH